IKDNAYFDEIFWLNSIDSAQHRSWSGFAFEQVCISHTRQMKKKLGISGVLTNISAWRSKKSMPGAQIDLIIDRKDDVINLCEMKYAGAGLFSINKKDSENLSQKKEAFISETGTKKAVHLTMVTTYGISKNMYSGMVQSEIILDDLFED
ncbi:MAG: hypothetical protein RBQ94_04780, partial [Methanimicrococcus sp.]|nr:hypothetical protein [Methanimicrococcus sp.]